MRIINAPTELPGCVFWIDAFDVASLTKDAAGVVSQWNDKSANAYALTQATQANRPVYGTVLGSPCVTFDGVNDYLSRANVDLFGTGPYTICAVLKVNASVNFQSYLGNTDTAKGWFLTQSSGRRDVGHNAVADQLGDPLQTLAFESWIAKRDAGDPTRLRVSATAQALAGATTSLTAAGAAGHIVLGAIRSGGAFSNYGSVSISEVICFNRALSDGEIAQVEQYLLTKWGTGGRRAIGAATDMQGCALWFDATDSASINRDAAGVVSQWNDKSANAAHAVEALDVNKPIYSANALDGYPCIDWGDGSVALKRLTVPSITFGTYSFFSVFRAQLTGSYLLTHVSDTSNGCYWYPRNTASRCIRAGGTSLRTLPNAWAADLVRRQANVRMDGTHYGHELCAGGDRLAPVDTAIANPGLTTITGPFYIGNNQSGSPFKGVFGEIIAYNRAVTDGEREVIERYIAKKWGIAPFMRSIATPQVLPGCVLALDAAKGITLDSSSKVQQWNDQSGANNHPSQAAAAARPAMGIGSNGRPCLVFDGVDDFLIANFALPQPHTIFIVGKFGSATTGSMISGNGNQSRFWRASSTQINYYGGGASVLVSGVTPESWHVHSLAFSGVASLYAQDAAPQSRRDSGTTSALGISIGTFSTSYAACSVSEVIVYNRLLSEGERFLVERMLLDKYGLQPARSLTAPTDLQGCSLWVDGQTSSITKDAANKVSQWDDLSGMGNHASNLAPASQPTYGAAVVNGLPGLRFERTLDTFLDAANVMLANGESEHTILVVGRRLIAAGGPGFLGLICQSTASGTRNNSAVGWDNAAGTSWYGATGYGLPVGDVAPLGRGSLLTKRYRMAAAMRGNIEGWVNAIGRCTDSIAFNLGNTTASIGRATSSGGASASGYVSAAIAYRRALTDGELAILSQYLSKRWLLYPLRSIASPTDIPNCVAWLDAAFVTKDASGNISRWDDLSGTSNHFTASGSTQPLAATLGANPIVSFDGVNDRMTATNHVSDDGTGSTIVIVCRKRAPATGLNKSAIGTAANAIYLDCGGSASWGGYSGGFKLANEQPGSMPRIFSARRGLGNVNGAFKLGADGISKGTFPSGGAVRSSTELSLATQDCDMDALGVAIYQRSISDGELYQVEQYFRRRFNL